MRKKHIILGVTASIAIYKACEIIRRLSQANLVLSVVMTKNAARLISPRVFSSLTGGRVYWDEFTPPFLQAEHSSEGRAGFTQPTNWEIEHISLAKRADLVLIAPATANIIGKIAGGIADDLLSTTVIATRAPVLIAPAMNESMYKNKIVQENIKKLKERGFKFIEPIKGRLICGEVGLGHLASVETIVKEVKRFLK